MAEHGQSSDPEMDSYHPSGLPLVEGYIELVKAGDSLAGAENENVGKIKLYAWRGHGHIDNPETDVAGVGWILAKDWWPYQKHTFVTPPFAGYTSGHSAFSRAGAEVLTMLTGNEYFPGGSVNSKHKKMSSWDLKMDQASILHYSGQPTVMLLTRPVFRESGAVFIHLSTMYLAVSLVCKPEQMHSIGQSSTLTEKSTKPPGSNLTAV